MIPVSIFEGDKGPDIMLGHKFNGYDMLHTTISEIEWKAIVEATKDQVKVILSYYLKGETPF